MSPIFGWVVFAGIFLDVVVYTIWLKRKTALSIIWGGIAGGMPILAGRALGTGDIDFIGLLLGLSILLWIPTHIITFSIRHAKDYAAAGIPTIPSVYGHRKTRLVVVSSAIGAACAIILAALSLGISWGNIWLLVSFCFPYLGIFL